jgi:hypothetical protein
MEGTYSNDIDWQGIEEFMCDQERECLGRGLDFGDGVVPVESDILTGAEFLLLERAHVCAGFYEV